MRNSVRDGNWSDPNTWDCSCVPGINSLATINDSVTLDVSRTYAYGNITINAGGKLIQDATGNRNIIFVGGSFVNYGEAEFTNFHISTSNSTLVQDGIMRVRTFTSYVNVQNTGTIEMDSMYLNCETVNSGLITGGIILSDSVFTNYERVVVSKLTNREEFQNANYFECDNLTNFSLFWNIDTMIVNGDFWNADKFLNGQFSPNAYIEIGNNFLSDNSGDSTILENQAYFKVLGNWNNTGNVYGNASGYFVVSNSSGNTGTMNGPFNFCDLTPPVTFPFIDLNTGTIDPAIVWCTAIGLKNYSIINEVSIFPNPNSGSFVVTSNSKERLNLIDELGRTLFVITLSENNNFKEEIKSLQNGVYYLKSLTNNSCEKIVVTN